MLDARSPPRFTPCAVQTPQEDALRQAVYATAAPAAAMPAPDAEYFHAFLSDLFSTFMMAAWQALPRRYLH